MNESKRIINLFLRGGEMSDAYIGMIADMQRHIRARLEQGVPLPEGARVALNYPDDEAFLVRSLGELEKDKSVVYDHFEGIRSELSNPEKLTDLMSPIIDLMGWSLNVDRSMENVINQHYQESDVLPPPPHYWNPIALEWRETFRFDSETDPRFDQQLDDLLHYLNTVENPWKDYVSK